MGLGVFEKIPVDGSISLAELSRVTGVQDSLLGTGSRLLFAKARLMGVSRKNDNFDSSLALNSSSRPLNMTYIQVPGPGNFFQFINDECLATLVHFHSYVKERAAQDGKPVQEPDDPLRNPYTHRHGMDGHPVWEIMAQFPDRLRAFQLGFMSQEDSVPIIGFYDYSALYDPEHDGDRATLVDVGGGQGQSIIQILQAFPTLRPDHMVLQDLPEPIAQAQNSKLLPEGVTAMVHDFWTPQPVKGAKAYFLRRVVHDYSDENCVKILAHLREAMGPDSKVLIADMVMPKRVHEADLPAAAMDNTVMVMGGKERTADGFNKILEAAGLKMVKIWHSREGGATGNIVEAMLPAGNPRGS
ncbi:O-methyltransferase [Fonsecaea pedrosoi]|nr:O-methyltransferase [Fonsecaea pedrosoi]